MDSLSDSRNSVLALGRLVKGGSLSDNLPEISMVLPCLNESRTIERCVQECYSAIRSCKINGEVVVADNGSSDGSQLIAREAGARVIEVRARGYGSALRAGIRVARGKYVLMADSDLSYDFTQLPRFLNELRKGYDLVIGCRMPRGGGIIQPGAMPWLHRWLGNPLLSLLGRKMFRSSVHDFHCGIRAFERKRLLALRLRTTGMEFATEMIIKACLAGHRIQEVPVTLRRDGRNRPPHLRTWRDGWRHLRFMLLHAPRWLFLYPGLVMGGFSAAGFLVLLFGPVNFGPIRFDTNALLMSGLGLLAGFQVTLLGLFSEAFSRRLGLLPPNALTDSLHSIAPFEKGLLFGGLILVVGACFLGAALVKWSNAEFGDLTYPDTLRLTIPALTGMALGVQIIFGGFLLAVIGVNSSSPDFEDCVTAEA